MQLKTLSITPEDRAFFSEEQLDVLQGIYDRINSRKRVTILGGAAGTGKTTLMKAVVASAKQARIKILLLAPTGKAAVRISEKTGIKARTIHSAMYGFSEEDPETGKLIWREPNLRKETGEGKCIVVIDEFSMVGSRVWQDCLANSGLNACFLCVGDHHQLPPVGDTSVLIGKTNYELNTVHRQLSDNPILEFACHTRESNQKGLAWLRSHSQGVENIFNAYHGVENMVKAYVESSKLEGFEHSKNIMLCFTNRQKDALNRAVREAIGKPYYLAKGDQIIVRTNNAMMGMMNGEIFTTSEVKIRNHKIWGKYYYCKLEGKKSPIMIPIKHFGASRSDWWEYVSARKGKIPKNFIHAEFGYAITTHSSQGSEWDHVYYYWEPAFTNLWHRNPEDARRLLYTAVTRTSSSLSIAR